MTPGCAGEPRPVQEERATLKIPVGSAAGRVPGELSKHKPQDTAVHQPKTNRETTRQPMTPPAQRLQRVHHCLNIPSAGTSPI